MRYYIGGALLSDFSGTLAGSRVRGCGRAVSQSRRRLAASMRVGHRLVYSRILSLVSSSARLAAWTRAVAVGYSPYFRNGSGPLAAY